MMLQRAYIRRTLWEQKVLAAQVATQIGILFGGKPKKTASQSTATQQPKPNRIPADQMLAMVGISFAED